MIPALIAYRNNQICSFKCMSFMHPICSLLSIVIASTLFLSSGGMLIPGENEAKSPVEERQEKEVESIEIFVRNSKPRKIRQTVHSFKLFSPPAKPAFLSFRKERNYQVEILRSTPLLC